MRMTTRDRDIHATSRVRDATRSRVRSVAGAFGSAMIDLRSVAIFDDVIERATKPRRATQGRLRKSSIIGAAVFVLGQPLVPCFEGWLVEIESIEDLMKYEI